MNLKDYYTQKKVKSLGFSERLIKELLPEPLLTDNPHHKDGKPMKLWDKKIVKQAMLCEPFLDYQVERQHRSFSMKNKAELKRLETKQAMNEALMNFKIKVISYSELYERTKSFNIWKYHQNITNLKEKDINKKMLNVVRHQLTNYDHIYRDLFGKYGRQDSFIYLKEEVLKQIARLYPFLEETVCEEIMIIRAKPETVEQSYQRYSEQQRKRKKKKAIMLLET